VRFCRSADPDESGQVESGLALSRELLEVKRGNQGGKRHAVRLGAVNPLRRLCGRLDDIFDNDSRASLDVPDPVSRRQPRV